MLLAAMEAASPVFPLAAIRASWQGEELTRNSHLGFAGSTAALHPAPTIANSNTASGLRVCLYDKGRRSRSTGKERDAETGLDYFGARYFSAAQGRWTSPDWSAVPQPVPYADLKDPQTLNLYSYVRNNPLSKADVDGHDALWVVDKQTRQTKLVIPVHFTGSGATADNISKIVNRDNQLDTGGSPVTIQVVSTDKPINGVLNTMDVSPGYDFKAIPNAAGEGINKLGGNTGHINSDSADSNDATAHDNLHFAGIKDQYREGPRDANGNRTSTPAPGYDNSNIMTSRSGTKLKPEQIQEAQKNSTTKQCTTDNGKTVCH
jgi:RHS repeat-associated protein